MVDRFISNTTLPFVAEKNKNDRSVCTLSFANNWPAAYNLYNTKPVQIIAINYGI